jgi:ABC-type dipeptide/oligopeptide/nickel transport system ATPase subunit
MNRNSSIALFGAVFVVAVGLMGSNGVFSMPTSGIIGTSGTNYHENAGNMLGHVTMIAQDPSGNIKAYRQMDNVVTNVGRTCTAQSLFGYDSVNHVGGNCQPRASFQYIGIGSLSRAEVTSDTSLDSYIVGSPPQARTTYLLTNSSSSTNAGGTYGATAVQTTSFIFSSPSTIGEADLQDAAATTAALEHAFARKAITPTIGVNSGDTLTVTWTIYTG